MEPQCRDCNTERKGYKWDGVNFPIAALIVLCVEKNNTMPSYEFVFSVLVTSSHKEYKGEEK